MWVGLFHEFKSDNEAFIRRIFEFLGLDTAAPIDTGEEYNTTSYPRNPKLLRLAYKMWEPIKTNLPATLLQQIKGVRSHTTRQKTGLTCSGTDRVTKRDPCHTQPRHASVRISTDSRSF